MLIYLLTQFSILFFLQQDALTDSDEFLCGYKGALHPRCISVFESEHDGVKKIHLSHT